MAAVVAWSVFRVTRRPLRERVSWSNAVYAERGELLRLTLSRDDKYRLFVPLHEFPASFRDAVLFKEDRYFEWHVGVNPLAVVRAAWLTFVAGGRRIGGSTISMQLARLLSGVPSRTLLGKARQVGFALWLEAMYAKEEILEAYLNLLPYGSNVEGAATASLIYFGKAPARLNLPEALTLAVIPQSPALRTVGTRGEIAKTARLMTARDQLFDALLAGGRVSAEDRASLALPFRMRGTRDLPFAAPHFVDWVLARGGGATTLDLRAQRVLEARLRAYVKRQHAAGVNNAAALLVDWTTHEVKAMVGSVDFFDGSSGGQVNGTLAPRSPGSTLKPFVYALGFDQGLIHPQSLLKDAPTAFGGYDPENFDRDFQGPVTAEDALAHSRNVPAVQVASDLKRPDLYTFLKSVGVALPRPAEHYGLSPVLGGAEVTMFDLARLYAMLPNGGALASLKSRAGETSLAQGAPITPEASFMVLDILGRVPRPPAAGGSAWSRSPLKAHWKTGTSHGFRDAWTVGVLGRYVLAVWLGNFDGAGNPAFIGRDLAAPLFFELAEALPHSDVPFRFADLNVKRVRVCAVSGRLPGAHCRQQRETWFIPGRSPIATCDIHREILVDAQTGYRLCQSGGGVPRVYEFWPSDLQRVFIQARLARVAPPAWDPRCRLDDLGGRGAPPRITSPRTQVTYSLRAGAEAPSIALNAVSDGDVRETFWFIDNAFVGRGRPRESLFWTARPGRHLVRVVDDQGRSDSRDLQVQVVE